MNTGNLDDRKAAWTAKLQAMPDAELARACAVYIHLAARVGKNPDAGYGWKADACYDEVVRRGRVDIYTEAQQYVQTAAAEAERAREG